MRILKRTARSLLHRTPPLLLSLLLLSSCQLTAPSYPKAELSKAVRDICLKEYDLDVEGRMVGRTFYVICELPGIVDRGLGVRKETLRKLEGAMLSSARVALSTDAEMDFLVIRAIDRRIKIFVTLIRYVPDIKGLLYYRYSRSDFENRFIMETESFEEEDLERYPELSMASFMAYLTASRLDRQFSSNAFVSAFLQIRKVKGGMDGNTLHLTFEGFGNEVKESELVTGILKNAVVKIVKDVITKYDKPGLIQRTLVKDQKEKTMFDLSREEILTAEDPEKEELLFSFSDQKKK